MYSNFAELTTLLLIMVYLYFKIKDKIALWILGYMFYLFCCTLLFRAIYPNVPFFSPTCEYMGFLFIVGLPFLIVFALIILEAEKRKTVTGVTEEHAKDLRAIFDLSRGNIIFWTIIVLINLIAFLLESKNK